MKPYHRAGRDNRTSYPTVGMVDGGSSQTSAFFSAAVGT